MIDITTEHLLSLSEASRLLPSRPHASTLWRWHRHGVRAFDGQMVRLEVVRIGGRVLTSKEALQRFADRLSAEHVDATRIPTPTQRSRAAQEAERHLEKLGI